jgi:predicted transcriptional regulator
MAAALTALLAGMALAGGLAVGQPAPAFTVVSGDEKPLNSSQLKGKVVTLFYEARDQVEKSRSLKNELNRFLAQQPPRIKKLVRPVAVVDCSGAAWPFKGFWRDGLKEASQKEGMTIYGDWDGKMRAAYGLPEDGTSFLVLGPAGKVKFIALDAGRVGPGQFGRIEQIITQAAAEAEAR